MDLYLVRHAIAFEHDPARWPNDADRPLTDEGQESFQRAARGLCSLVPAVDLVLSSPYVRAWQTAQILESAAGWPAPRQFEALEPGHAPNEVASALGADEYSALGAIALVGHEPDLSRLAAYLLTGKAGGADVEMKKGAVAFLRCGGRVAGGEAQLRWLLPPKVLRALSG